MTCAEWAKWLENLENNEKRIVKQDKLSSGVLVSTVFLGLDHGFGHTNLPILYETMVFGGKLSEKQERYFTREEALAGHQKWLDKAIAKDGGAD